jgi:hypothetical protein
MLNGACRVNLLVTKDRSFRSERTDSGIEIFGDFRWKPANSCLSKKLYGIFIAWSLASPDDKELHFDPPFSLPCRQLSISPACLHMRQL